MCSIWIRQRDICHPSDRTKIPAYASTVKPLTERVMNSDQKREALAAWREVLETPEVRMAAADQYEELVRLADNYQRGGLISEEEKNALIFEATNRYASLVAGAGQGT